MKLDYQVHSLSVDQAPVMAKVAGKEREVLAEVLTVELTGPGSALTFRFDDVEAAQKLFGKRGKKVTLTFAGAK